ncbi:hypothetical protein JQT77_15510 [Sulfitobacter mediterraneus]|nr:hypothetical protein [Sulfitobacter mediterraneus]MBM1311580.1 hypothetical protein [Sulfitobacter mediterraneus]MBM1323823.1 hypothetical protein [Sulfitobacter mediterraneus]MBM1327735.1 hypothetical protein [Sulfitobacter mediterraneus]MBM1399083.1 hypothetical protein [Sulfitobacter mediterraneus]MBM1402969.1 hypothetical protein [Sulfitobacter mediterraneus]
MLQAIAAAASALHGVLALLHEWYCGDPALLCYVNAVRLKAPERGSQQRSGLGLRLENGFA